MKTTKQPSPLKTGTPPEDVDGAKELENRKKKTGNNKEQEPRTGLTQARLASAGTSPITRYKGQAPVSQNPKQQ